MKKRFHQTPHYRTSKRGKKFEAGRGSKKVKVKRFRRPTRKTMLIYKDLSYNQIKKRYPIHPLRDDDGDKKRNWEDCRPFNRKKQDEEDDKEQLSRYEEIKLGIRGEEHNLTDKDREEIKEMVMGEMSDFPITGIKFVGSRTLGRAGEHSDIDVAVRMKKMDEFADEQYPNQSQLKHVDSQLPSLTYKGNKIDIILEVID